MVAELVLLCLGGLFFDDRLLLASLGLLGLLGLGFGQTGLQFAVLQRLDVQISVVVLAINANKQNRRPFLTKLEFV